MSRYRHAHFQTGLFLDLIRHLIGYARERILLHLFLVILLGQFRIFFRDRAFRHRQDGETAAALFTLTDGFDHLVDLVRDLRDQDDVRPGCHTGI